MTSENFTRMFDLRKGALPVKTVYLNGDESAIEKFKNEFLLKHHSYEIDKLVTFVTTLPEGPCIIIDLPSEDKLDRFIEELKLDGLTREFFKPMESDFCSYLNDNYEQALLNTLDAHYTDNCASNAFKDSDFDWFRKTRTDIPREVLKDVTSVDPSDIISDLFEDKNSEEPAKKDLKSDVPTPEVVPDNTPTAADLRDLTPEETAENNTLLSRIRASYEACIAAIDESCNTLFIPIKRRIADALEKNDFSTQLTVLYLEVSSDYSTPVYKALYEADKEAITFNNSVHRQYLECGCPGCNHTWYEDITFLKAGINDIRCPKCGMSRLIEK